MKTLINACALVMAAALGGCVSYSQHELAPLDAWPPKAQSVASKPSAMVRVTTLYQANDNPAGAAGGPLAAKAETIVAQAMREGGRFTQVTNAQVPADVYAESTLTNHEQFSMAGAIITGATFFVIPGTARNTFTLDTVFKDKNGKELAHITKHESVRTWMHLVLIFGIPFQQDANEIVKQLAESTVDEAVKRQLF